MDCYFKDIVGSECGSYYSDSTLLPLNSCNIDITSHLAVLGITGKRGRTGVGQISEKDLILNRAGFFDKDEEFVSSLTICPKHRRDLSTDWPGKKRFTCGYPTHKGLVKQIHNPRRINLNVSQEIFKEHGAVVPAGTAWCDECRKNHSKPPKTVKFVPAVDQSSVGIFESTFAQPGPSGISTTDDGNDTVMVVSERDVSTGDVFQPPSTEEVSSGDADETSSQASSQASSKSVPENEISIWTDEVQLQHERRQTLNDTVETLTHGRTSPILSTLNTSWDDISLTQQKYYQRKAKETIMAALSVISPGQEENLWDAVRKEVTIGPTQDSSARRKSFDPSSPIIDSLVKAYEQATSWQTKRQILSIFANDFTRLELTNLIPSLTKWKIDQARQHATDTGKGQTVISEPIHRRRISPSQIQHFIDFISRPEMVQDVAFGTKTLKLDSGDSIIIPAVVRTIIPSRIIEHYQAYCTQVDFQPAGMRSLYRMIEVCAASLQKSLQGLDNTTAEGTDAIDSLNDLVDTLSHLGSSDQFTKQAHQGIKDAKRYLKTEFKGHVGRERMCAEHCTTYALSDQSEQKLQRPCTTSHDTQCKSCISLEKVMKMVTDEIDKATVDKDQRERMKYECKQYIEAINAWKAHLLRTVNQEEAKQDALASLDKHSCLIVMDWAMKFLPLRYRERMSEFFAKRGKSWHVSAVITKNDAGKLEVECFVHIFESCTQNSFAVASIIENLLINIKKQSPQVDSAFFRSDNAGCYHSGVLLLSLPEIGKRTGITPLRYDFSDPQSGKDICDRKTAPMKSHMRRWVNEKHDVLTALDMKTALESHGGIKGCRIAVVKIDQAAENASPPNKIPGISRLNNFAFTKKGIRVWRAYNVGLGKMLFYKDLNVKTQQDTSLHVINDFGPKHQTGSLSNSQAQRAEIFSCNEVTCILTFKSLEDAEAHMDTGKHVKAIQSESVYDSVKKMWAEKITEVNLVSSGETETSLHDTQSLSSQCSKKEGWALKVTKRGTRMGERVRSFLIKKFKEGASGGTKADPNQVAEEMKVTRDDRGMLVFNSEEWRSAKQITSFFSRLSALQRRGEAIDGNDDHDEDDMAAIENEDMIQSLNEAVIDDMVPVMNHPIIIDDINLCDLLQSNGLEKLKLPQLRSICRKGQLQTPGHLNRKKTFIDPLYDFVKKCSCQQGDV